MIRKILLAAVVAASLGGVTVPAAAADIYVRREPPPPREEVVPAPRRGYAWAPGYWDWRGKRHVWHAGSWVRERPGHRYRETRWVERDGRWYLSRGRWERMRDRDGDGVPDRFDRRPDNPRRN